jgi:hypothetical protein
MDEEFAEAETNPRTPHARHLLQNRVLRPSARWLGQKCDAAVM